MFRVTIFQRLTLGYLAILVIVLCLGGYSVWRLSQLSRITKSLSSVDSEIIRTTSNVKDTLISLAEFEQKYIISGDTDFYDQFHMADNYLTQKVHLLETVLLDPSAIKQINSFKKNYRLYLDETAKEIQWIQSRVSYDQATFQADKSQQVNELINSLDAIILLARVDMQKKIRIANTIGDQSVHFTIIATFAAIVMALIIAFINARTINRPIISLMKGTKQIARGEFDSPIRIDSPPEIQALAESFNAMCARLEELDQMKADFIAHVSHDLRTPLTSIREASGLLLTGKLGRPSADQRNLFMIIHQECERLIKSVNSILDLSRLENGMMSFEMGKYDLPRLLKKSIVRLHPIAKKKGIHLHLKLSNNLPPVYADWEKLDQVVVNILGNALTFTPSGGHVTVSAVCRPKRVSEKLKNQMIEVCIADTGCGIAEQDLGTIFEKFRKVKGKGAGLGLAIAKYITNAHGGKLWVKSKKGAGSAFFFTLPAAS